MTAQHFENLAEMQQKSCRKFADRPIFGEKKGGQYEWITYKEFGDMVDQCRAGLSALGVSKDKKVCIISDNRVQWAVAAYATYSLGAVYVPMYEAQLPKEWAYIVKDSGSMVLIVPTTKIFDKVVNFPNEIDCLKHIINLAGSGAGSWDDLLAKGKAAPVASVEPKPEDEAGLIYTSGTTGNPKGVILTHGNITSNINAMHEVMDITPDDVSLSFLPWAHSFGQVVELHGLMSMGGSLGLAESVAKLLENLGEVKPTLLFSVPRVFNRIYDGLQKRMATEKAVKKFMFHRGLKLAKARRELRAEGKTPGFWLTKQYNFFDKVVFKKVRERFGGRLRYAFSGGAALSREVAQFIDDMNIIVYEGYGLTETSPICTANMPGAQRIGSVGKPIPGVTVLIDGAEKVGDEGEVLVSGPNIMKGYHGLEKETDEAIFERDGVRIFRTGDLGRLDKDGFLYITGRVKELYKLENGKYVSPAPLEEKLQLSLFVNQALIYGDNKTHNVVLIVPDAATLQSWAESNGLAGKSLEELIDNREVRAIFEREITEFSKEFKGFERPRAFALIAKEFSGEDGLLTPSLKIKRRNVVAKYKDIIDGLYTNAPPRSDDAGRKKSASDAGDEARA